MGNIASTHTTEILGYYKTNNISYKSKRLVAGQYMEYKNLTFLLKMSDIPKGTSYEYGIYDFASKCLLLLNDGIPRCMTSSLDSSGLTINFQPEKKYWEPYFKAYFNEIKSSPPLQTSKQIPDVIKDNPPAYNPPAYNPGV